MLWHSRSKSKMGTLVRIALQVAGQELCPQGGKGLDGYSRIRPASPFLM